jgi:cysteinyl-tRNA synthetase
MLSMIQSLIDQNKAYAIGGDVFYSIKSFKDYGCLSGKNIDDLQSGARVEVNATKRNPLDFALWKKSKPGEPFWNSPWGAGRPGWHIECSAMSKKFLGDTFDIHGGGKDLVFPHHENEIAQSCGCTGQQPVRYWVHNGFVNIDKEKMSKSLGNFFTIREIYKKYHPEVLRLFLISSHYRSPIDFSEKNLDDATKVLTRFYEGLAGARNKTATMDLKLVPDFQEKIKNHPLTKKFEVAMNDDLNTAVVMAHMNEELKNLNSAVKDKNSANLEEVAVATAAWETAGRILGLFFLTPEEFEKELFEIKNRDLGLEVSKIEQLIANRNAARQSKNWTEADRCRDDLVQMGVLIEDTPNGTEWKLK